jgi:hypothetical protein
MDEDLRADPNIAGIRLYRLLVLKCGKLIFAVVDAAGVINKYCNLIPLLLYKLCNRSLIFLFNVKVHAL